MAKISFLSGILKVTPLILYHEVIEDIPSLSGDHKDKLAERLLFDIRKTGFLQKILDPLRAVKVDGAGIKAQPPFPQQRTESAFSRKRGDHFFPRCRSYPLKHGKRMFNIIEKPDSNRDIERSFELHLIEIPNDKPAWRIGLIRIHDSLCREDHPGGKVNPQDQTGMIVLQRLYETAGSAPDIDNCLSTCFPAFFQSPLHPFFHVPAQLVIEEAADPAFFPGINAVKLFRSFFKMLPDKVRGVLHVTTLLFACDFQDSLEWK
jgi:hypothetical protein